MKNDTSHAPRVQFTLRSENVKTGPIPVSMTEQATCPDACPLKGKGCYAGSGPMAWVWRKVGTGQIGNTWQAFLAAVRALPLGQVWRHNQAGDLPGVNNRLDTGLLAELVEANNGKRGFTYTHKPMTQSAQQAVASANRSGFTVNLSADSMAEADMLAQLECAPVVVTVSQDHPANSKTPLGRNVVVCPAQQRDGITCASCKLCSLARRDFVIAFRAHGPFKRMLSERLK